MIFFLSLRLGVSALGAAYTKGVHNVLFSRDKKYVSRNKHTPIFKIDILD